MVKGSTIIGLAVGGTLAGVGIYFLVKELKKKKKIELDNAVVQYAQDTDEPVANYIASSLGLPIIKTDVTDALFAYQQWIIVGAQVANPVYAIMLAEATPPFPVVTESTNTYSSARYANRDVYGIAGWETPQTTAIAQNFVKDVIG